MILNDKKIINYKKLMLRNVPPRSTLAELRDNLFFDFDKSAIVWDRALKKPTGDSSIVFIEFMHPQICRLAKFIVNSIKYRGIQCDYALDFPKNAPRAFMKDLKLINDEDGECANCKSNEATFICIRCHTTSTATFYCSSECQAQHWDFHRWECFALPMLIDFKDAEEHLESKEKIRMTNFMPQILRFLNVNDFVVIVHVESPRIIHVRHANSDMEKFSSEVGEFSEHHNVTKRPEVKNIQGVMIDGKCCRAQIQFFDLNGNCTLYLIDYGKYVCKIPWKDLKQLNQAQRGVKRLTQTIFLDGISSFAKRDGRVDEYFNNCAKQCFKVVSVESRRHQIYGKIPLVKLQRSNGSLINDEIRNITKKAHKEKVDEIDNGELDYDDEGDGFEIIEGELT